MFLLTFLNQCKEAIRIKHQAKNHFHRHPTMANFESFKENYKLSDKKIKGTKKIFSTHLKVL